jgi:hypothetical protein
MTSHRGNILLMSLPGLTLLTFLAANTHSISLGWDGIAMGNKRSTEIQRYSCLHFDGRFPDLLKRTMFSSVLNMLTMGIHR